MDGSEAYDLKRYELVGINTDLPQFGFMGWKRYKTARGILDGIKHHANEYPHWKFKIKIIKP